MREKAKMPSLEKRRTVKDPRRLLAVRRVKSHDREDYGRCNRIQSRNKKLAQLLMWWKVEELQDALDWLEELTTIELYKISKYGRG